MCQLLHCQTEIIYKLLFSTMAKDRLRIWRSNKVLSIAYFWLAITLYGFVVGTFKANLASYSLIEATSQNLSPSNRSSLSQEGFVIFFFVISTTGQETNLFLRKWWNFHFVDFMHVILKKKQLHFLKKHTHFHSPNNL